MLGMWSVHKGASSRNKAVAMCKCHNVHDRDVNTAKNLLIWSTGSSPGINACGDFSADLNKGIDICESIIFETIKHSALSLFGRSLKAEK